MDQDYAPLTEHGKLLFEDEDGNARIMVWNQKIDWIIGSLGLLAFFSLLALMALLVLPGIEWIWFACCVFLFLPPFLFYYMVRARGPLKVYEAGISIDDTRWPFLRFEDMTYLTQLKSYPYRVTIKTASKDIVRIRFDTEAWLESVYPFMREYFNRAHHFETKAAASGRLSRPKR